MDKRSGEKRTMDFDCYKCLQNCKYKIVLMMSPNEVLKEQNMKEIIGSDIDHKTIEEQKTSTKMNDLIFQHIQRGGRASYCKFKTILQETKHFKLLDVLTREENGITENESDLFPRIVSHSLKLCEKVIIEDLDSKVTLDRLKGKEFTKDIILRDISEQTTSTQRNKLIFYEVDKQGTVGYKILKIILEETNQTGVLESLQLAERDVANQLVSTREIFKDFFYYSMQKSAMRSNAYMLELNAKIELFRVVRVLAIRFENEFDRKFSTGYINRLNPHSMTSIEDVLKVLLKDEVNWGGIIGAISFAGAMGVILRRNGISEDEILNKTSKYLETRIGQWIIDKGGWATLIDFSKKKKEDGNDGLDTSIPVDNSGDTDERPRKVQKRHNEPVPVPVEIDNVFLSTSSFGHLMLSVVEGFILAFAFRRQ